MLADIAFEDLGPGPVAHIRGEIDMSNVSDVSGALQSAVEHTSAGLIVNFAQTTYLDSAGVHFIFDLAKQLRDRGQRLYLVVPDESPVGPVLEIVNVDALALRCETLEAALERLAQHAADVPQSN